MGIDITSTTDKAGCGGAAPCWVSGGYDICAIMITTLWIRLLEQILIKIYATLGFMVIK
jgi:hypothetical protein